MFAQVARCFMLCVAVLLLAVSANAQPNYCLERYAQGDAGLGISKSEAEELINDVARSIRLRMAITVFPCRYMKGQKVVALEPDGGTPGRPPGQYVVYDPDWVQEVIGTDRFQAIALFGHELGHFLNQHFTYRRNLPRIQQETEADEFAGCAVARMGGSWDTLSGLLSRLRKDTNRDPDYPDRLASLDAAQKGFQGCSGGGTAPPSVASFVADAKDGLFCGINEVRNPFVTFFDYVTFGLKNCTPGGQSATRTFAIRYPAEAPRSITPVVRDKYNHCFVSDLGEKAPKVAQAIRAFASANRQRIPCEVTSSVTRVVNVSYLDAGNSSKAAAFAQTFDGSNGQLRIDQIPSDRAAKSDQMTQVVLKQDWVFDPETLMAQVRAFNFNGVPTPERRTSASPFDCDFLPEEDVNVRLVPRLSDFRAAALQRLGAALDCSKFKLTIGTGGRFPGQSMNSLAYSGIMDFRVVANLLEALRRNNARIQFVCNTVDEMKDDYVIMAHYSFGDEKSLTDAEVGKLIDAKNSAEFNSILARHRCYGPWPVGPPAKK